MRLKRFVSVLSVAVCLLNIFANPMTATAKEITILEMAKEEQKDDLSSQLEDYFAHTVFVGDSLAQGYRQYCITKRDSYLGGMRFLSAAGYGVYNALRDLDSDSPHPVYQGEKHYIWDSIALMEDVDRVYLQFGMNDMVPLGVDGTVEGFIEIVDNIKELSPDVEIHIVSATYVLAGKEGKNLNNTNLSELNEKMKALCEEEGWGFVDLATATSDGNGALNPDLCYDDFVHVNSSGYDVWTEEIVEYVSSGT